jgi:hypothetical protein
VQAPPVEDREEYDHLNPDSQAYAEREYQAGVAEGRAYSENVRMLGREAADAIDIANELKHGSDY